MIVSISILACLCGRPSSLLYYSYHFFLSCRSASATCFSVIALFLDKLLIMFLHVQDFAHVQTFRGHEHKVMAVVFVDQEKPLCISADNGGVIFCWEVVPPLGQEPLKKWCEEKDWRYSGIHALAISESGCLYTGSGDRLIKVWSLRVSTLCIVCSMSS